MAWDQGLFEDAVRNKMAVQKQNANSDTTRADAAMQSVQQQPGMQAAQDAAAMDRARLASQTQTNIAGMQEQGAMDRTGMNTRAQREIAALQDQGATTRTGMQTSTQKSIADQSLGFEREKLAEDSYLKRQGLTRPITTYDQDGMRTSTPGVNFSRPNNVGIESPLDIDTIKRRSAAAGIAY